MAMSLTLYCKSYRTDLKRAIRLEKSIRQFNAEKIPFYLSAPAVDVPLFKEHLVNFDVEVIADDLIHQQNPGLNIDRMKSLPGSISQQVIKSEFWRLGLSDVYVCLDSDAVFIRPLFSMGKRPSLHRYGRRSRIAGSITFVRKASDCTSLF